MGTNILNECESKSLSKKKAWLNNTMNDV